MLNIYLCLNLSKRWDVSKNSEKKKEKTWSSWVSSISIMNYVGSTSLSVKNVSPELILYFLFFTFRELFRFLCSGRYLHELRQVSLLTYQSTLEELNFTHEIE